MTIDFAVYDNKNDEVIGVWDNYATAENFLLENVSADDIWEVFPMVECTVPVK